VATIHAESNAILQAARNGFQIDWRHHLCDRQSWNCFKEIANSGICRIVYGESIAIDRNLLRRCQPEDRDYFTWRARGRLSQRSNDLIWEPSKGSHALPRWCAASKARRLPHATRWLSVGFSAHTGPFLRLLEVDRHRSRQPIIRASQVALTACSELSL